MKRLAFTLVAVVGLALTVIGMSGEAQAQGADNAADVEAGMAVYASSCAGCHGDDGTGVAGLGRPLIGIAAQGDRDTHIASITNGKGGMPAFGEQLSEDEISQATSYVRLTFVEAAEAEPEAAEELAETGFASQALATVGMTMLLGGWGMAIWSRSEQRKLQR